MQTAALIVAAGMSSRMGDFKPMLSIGSITIAQRVVATFHQAGIEKIVMVTGYNAVSLERHLSDCGVIFLRNEAYETTQMFDSVKIGLAYLRGKCDRVLFTPVDIPLFTAGTVHALLDSGAELACPVCQGQTGHPILLRASVFDRILADSGEQGLKGAVERCGIPMQHVPVEDPGTLHDADTPEDYSALVDYHNAQLVRPVITISLTKEKPFFDERMAMLLMLVDETKSVRAAGQRMQLSYSSCWNKIHTLESQLGCTLVARSQGGAGGSQSHLTDQGILLLQRYGAFQRRIREDTDALFEEYFGGLFA